MKYAEMQISRPPLDVIQRAEIWNQRGISAMKAGNVASAISDFSQALAIWPDCMATLNNMAVAYYIEGQHTEARNCLDKIISLDAEATQARFMRLIYALQIIYKDHESLCAARADYTRQLEALSHRLQTTGAFDRFVEVFGNATPFYLPYQGQNDLELQRRYGALACRVSEARFKTPSLPWSKPRQRIRVGIVSGFFRRHTVWHLMLKAWVSQLDRSRFEVFGYHTGGHRDECTEFAAVRCDRFVQGPMPLAQWRATILDDSVDVLLYPEVGMDMLGSQLAAQRLARVQCNSWGHPQTSGFPTLDYFLSSEAMEANDAELLYTEKLVKLPNLGIYYEPSEATGLIVSRQELGLRAEAMLFWCCQSLYKYLPQFDDVFARIACQVPNAQFAFIEYRFGPTVTSVFRARLSSAFAKYGLDYQVFCVFLRPFSPAQFAASFAACDIILDSIGWSGGQTTLESLPHNRPIVCMSAPLMRGNHTAAILKLMGLDELVAGTMEEYIAIAVRLAHDQAWRDRMSKQIAARQGRLYRDHSVIAALEGFLEKATNFAGDCH